jgi:decaprenylphospho-beta-D-ribofuranose 2-oxidase
MRPNAAAGWSFPPPGSAGSPSSTPVSGLATCEAGVSLEQLMVAGPAGRLVRARCLAGTRQVTIGGAIAADVHGKNHHVAGSFARHVPFLRPDAAIGGELRTVDAAEGDPDLFWATAGGMGLTGLILRACGAAEQGETSRVRVDTVRTS